MTFYKFLASGRRHPLRPIELPPQGVWIECGHEASDGPEGLRAYAAVDLAHWVDDELWEVELSGAVTVLPSSVIAPRGRLVRRVEAWTEDVGRDLAAACAWRAVAAVTERLAAAGHAGAAQALRAPTALADLARIASAASADAPAGWADPIGLLAEAGTEAVTAPIVVALFTATVAVAGWDEAGQAEERRWQSAWIAERLGLAG